MLADVKPFVFVASALVDVLSNRDFEGVVDVLDESGVELDSDSSDMGVGVSSRFEVSLSVALLDVREDADKIVLVVVKAEEVRESTGAVTALGDWTGTLLRPVTVCPLITEVMVTV